jgi:hypothetical protein
MASTLKAWLDRTLKHPIFHDSGCCGRHRIVLLQFGCILFHRRKVQRCLAGSWWDLSGRGAGGTDLVGILATKRSGRGCRCSKRRAIVARSDGRLLRSWALESAWFPKCNTPCGAAGRCSHCQALQPEVEVLSIGCQTRLRIEPVVAQVDPPPTVPVASTLVVVPSASGRPINQVESFSALATKVHDAANFPQENLEDGADWRRKHCDAVLTKLGLGGPPPRSLEAQP